MRTAFLFISMLLINSASAQWTKINTGLTQNLNHIYFKDAQTGFCVGGDLSNFSKAIILRTTDTGNTWTTVFSDSTMGLSEITSKNNIITAIGNRPTGEPVLLQSLDNGNNWILDTIALGTSLQYFNSDLFFLNGALKKLAFGTVQNLLNDVGIYDINDVGKIFCIKYPSVAFAKSINGGSTWNTTNPNFNFITSNSLSHSSLKAFGDTIIFYATYPTAIAYTYDGGGTWSEYFPSTAAPPTGAIIISPSIIVGGQNSKEIYKSEDEGQTFVIQDTTTDIIKSFFFLNENLGFLCGENGMIYKTTNGGSITSIQKTETLKKKLKIFPNPAKDNIAIEVTEDITIQLVHLQGINGEFMKEWKGDVRNLSTENIPAGFYILEMRTNKGLVREKIVIEQ